MEPELYTACSADSERIKQSTYRAPVCYADKMVQKLSRLLFCIALLIATQPDARAENEVTVELFAARGPLQSLVLRGPFTIASKFAAPPEQRFVLQCEDGQLFLRSVSRTQTAAANNRKSMPIGQRAVIATSSPRGICIELPDGTTRHYRGNLLVAPKGTAVLSVKNKVHYDAYIASVIGSESLPGTPEEALKAQSVLVQTLMLRYHQGDILQDTTQTQAYSGADYERPEARRAYAATRAQKLMCNGRPVNIYFHSACSGRTSSSRLFAGKKPTMPCDTSVECSYCKNSPFWRKKAVKIPRRLYLRDFPDGAPSIESRDDAGRPLTVRYSNGHKESGYGYWLRIGQKLGWDKLPGTRFEIRDRGAVIELSSTGAGHGIGLCQWGARGLADEGLNYRAILRYYFPGSTVEAK
ncbi:MAG: SpoIID/LytB domain-containing protein [Candidatus Obscuribacterales bacterium]|nr:SpoIID/LytB domain-containing protein [Candidatus Obscuribacterales bacterium]